MSFQLPCCPRCESSYIPRRRYLCDDCLSSDHLEITPKQWRAYAVRLDLEGMTRMQLQSAWERAVLRHRDLRPGRRGKSKMRTTPKPQHIKAFDAPDAERVIMGPEPAPMPHLRVEIEPPRIRIIPKAPRVLAADEERVLLMQRGYALWRGWGDIAADRTERMVRYNLRLAIKWSLKYLHTADLPDLFSLCAQGIFWAVEDYDLNTTYKFSTYACNKLRGAVSQYMRQQAKEGLAAHQFIELDDGSLLDYADERQSPHADEHKRQNVIDWVRQSLTPRDAEIVLKRHGLVGGDGQTLQAIGDQEGLTKERVRQVLKASHDKLRAEPGRRDFSKLLLAS